MARKRSTQVPEAVAGLARVLDAYEGRYRELRGAATFGEYVGGGKSVSSGADEQTLTEPLLASLLEEVLGFGKGDYFPQLGKSGLKPDFTPRDLVTHRFVLDAKGSAESLGAHVAQNASSRCWRRAQRLLGTRGGTGGRLHGRGAPTTCGLPR